MKKSELIRENFSRLAKALADRYETVVGCGGQVQYKVYIWSDGEIQYLEQPQGDNSYLAPNNHETRELYYLTTVGGYRIDLADAAGLPAVETEEDKQEAVEFLVDEYKRELPDLLDELIYEAEREEI